MAGLLSGIAGAALLGGTISAMLYDVDPLDPAGYALAIACVRAAVATASALFPIRQIGIPVDSVRTGRRSRRPAPWRHGALA